MTEQLPALRVHEGELKLPEPMLLKVTVPPGVIAVPEEVSETVAVQVVGAFTGAEEVQLMVVEVARFETVSVKVPELPR